MPIDRTVRTVILDCWFRDAHLLDQQIRPGLPAPADIRRFLRVRLDEPTAGDDTPGRAGWRGLSDEQKEAALAVVFPDAGPPAAKPGGG